MNVGKHIRLLLSASGCSQTELVRGTGISKNTLSYIINGHREMTVSQGLRIEAFFHLERGELLTMQLQENIRTRGERVRRSLADRTGTVFDSVLSDAQITRLARLGLTPEELFELYEAFDYKSVENLRRILTLKEEKKCR